MSRSYFARLWESIWYRAGRVPLGIKIFGIVLTATCLTGSGILVWTYVWLHAPAASSTAPFHVVEPVSALLIAMTVGLAVAWLLTNLLTFQIKQLTLAAREYPRGDLQLRAPVWAEDEIGNLARAFNATVDNLARSQADLEASNNRLLERNEELAALYELAVMGAQTMNVDLVVSRSLKKVLEVTNFEAGAVLLFDDIDTLSFANCQHLPQALGDVSLFASDRPLVRRAVATGELVVASVNDSQMLHDSDLLQTAIDFGYRTVCASPIQVRQEVIGVMVAFQSGVEIVDDKTRSLLVAVCSQSGSAITNARLWDELKHKEAVRARLLARVVTAQEQERARISRELHDETGQALTALLVQLKVLERLPDEQSVAAHAVELRKIVLTTLEEVRRLARDLRPAMLDDLGLVPTLDWHIRTFNRNTDLQINFEADVPETFRLPAAYELALYRVVQEALTNVARHANATRASIKLNERNGQVRLVVEDDGCGFDVNTTLAAQGRGVGLPGIAERVELIGGTLTLDSTAGRGTRLCVEIDARERAEIA
ncbi:MAG: GAF domain-containing protein [Anaerolineae bacterium]|nr:GAF domain-containing protein [Anaerolineae bacterium]